MATLDIPAARDDAAETLYVAHDSPTPTIQVYSLHGLGVRRNFTNVTVVVHKPEG